MVNLESQNFLNLFHCEEEAKIQVVVGNYKLLHTKLNSKGFLVLSHMCMSFTEQNMQRYEMKEYEKA